jgi:hypothetical protein
MPKFINPHPGSINLNTSTGFVRVMPGGTCELPLEKGRALKLLLVEDSPAPLTVVSVPVAKPVAAAPVVAAKPLTVQPSVIPQAPTVPTTTVPVVPAPAVIPSKIIQDIQAQEEIVPAPMEAHEEEMIKQIETPKHAMPAVPKFDPNYVDPLNASIAKADEAEIKLAIPPMVIEQPKTPVVEPEKTKEENDEQRSSFNKRKYTKKSYGGK